LISLTIQDGQGAIWEGSELVLELKKYEKMFFSRMGAYPSKSHHISGIQSPIQKTVVYERSPPKSYEKQKKETNRKTDEKCFPINGKECLTPRRGYS